MTQVKKDPLTLILEEDASRMTKDDPCWNIDLLRLLVDGNYYQRVEAQWGPPCIFLFQKAAQEYANPNFKHLWIKPYNAKHLLNKYLKSGEYYFYNSPKPQKKLCPTTYNNKPTT